jgi:hypothetical protein
MAAQKTSNKGGKSQATRITKVEGLRRALAKLGQDARTEDLQAYLKKHFDLEMTKDHIYVSRGEIRKQEAKKMSAAKPAAPVHSPAARGNGAGGSKPALRSEAGGITKIDAVRRALRRLGKDATPLAIQGFLKKTFRLEMTREYISTYKSEVIRKDAAIVKPKVEVRKPEAKPKPISASAAMAAFRKGEAKPKPISASAAMAAFRKGEVKPKPTPAPAATAAPRKDAPSLAQQVKATNENDGIHIEDIQEVKGLMGRVGATELRKLIDVLAK